MITTRDVMRQNDDIRSIWELGMHENAMTKEQIIKANIQEITGRIISRKEGFVFRLSGVLLFGIARLYSKKSLFFLMDCEAALSRISLNFQREERKKIKEKPNKERDAIEIDEETMKLWTKEGNLENIIEKEKKEGFDDSATSNLVLNTRKDNSSEMNVPVPIIDDDFGNVPFDIPNDIEMNPANDEIEFQPQMNDQIQETLTDPPNMLELNDQQVENIQKQKKKFIIDSIPIIPLTQLSVILEDTSKIVCNRPITQGIVDVYSKSYTDSKEFEFLVNEVKKIAEKVPVFQTEEKNYENDAIELPNISENEEHFIEDNENTNSNEAADQDRFEQQLYSVNLLTNIKNALNKERRAELLQVVQNQNRKELALSFFTALSLQNKGIVEIQQSSERSISLSKGPNFFSLF